ncbi:MAG: flagellar hook-associated protein 3 [Pseudobutyrivibrio sp.]|nr:flagellar hook-associated protein 3 [Pseudobutyrivibrio sp.]
MRVTNKMIMKNAASNINTTKEFVDKRNKQMTSQKQIDRPSDDPVIAVRSLRLATTLSQVTQYHTKNIPDAASWLDVTETSLINIRDIMKDCRELSVMSPNDTYNEQDRKTMITQFESLQKQMFAEGNADYANRTVFTGYRTNCNLTFTENEDDTKYRVDQSFKVEDYLEEKRYYAGSVTVPTTEAEVGGNAISDISLHSYYRIRINYDQLESFNKLEIKSASGNIDSLFTMYADPADETQGVITNNTTPITDSTGNVNVAAYSVTVYENEKEWAAADTTVDNPIIGGDKLVGADQIIVIRETGDIIFGENVAAKLKEEKATINVQYDKIGFDKGELRPEYYYNCKKMRDPNMVGVNDANPITYTKFDDAGEPIYFDIQYTVAANQTISINTEASQVFDSSIQRDITEMIDAVQNTIYAHNKIDTIKSMMRESQYQSDENQEFLNKWLDAATKEKDFFEDNMQKLFERELGKIDSYYAKINLGITDLGCKKDSLDLTENRVGDQRQTVQSLQSKNDDIELSQIIIDYTAAYTAYQASLTAAGKLSESTLLNYI